MPSWRRDIKIYALITVTVAPRTILLAWKFKSQVNNKIRDMIISAIIR